MLYACVKASSVPEHQSLPNCDPIKYLSHLSPGGMSHFIASGTGPNCSKGVPVELGLLTILAAFGTGFGLLCRVLTLKMGRRRRRRSDVEGCKDLESKQEFLFIKFLSSAWHLIWHVEFFTLIFSRIDGKTI